MRMRDAKSMAAAAELKPSGGGGAAYPVMQRSVRNSWLNLTGGAIGQGIAVTALVFPEHAHQLCQVDGLEVVDLEDVPGLFESPLPRLTFHSLPTEGRWLEPQALMADPTRMPPPRSKPAAQPESDPAPSNFTVIGRKQFTPENVVGYSGKGRNPVPDDPEHAQKMGFRAPITAGNQLINVLIEPLAILIIGSVIGTIILGVILAITSANDLAI